MSMHSAEVSPAVSHQSAQPSSLIAFALFGQFFLLAVILLLLGGGGYMLLTAFSGGMHLAWAVKLGIPMVLAGAATLWTVLHLKPKEGPHIVITRDVDVPLWGILDEMAETLQAPRVDRIHITTDYNASASRPARAMPLPWHVPYVVSIGAPLLLLLDEEELKAVLAHELAHHSHRHTSISLMIWRSLANADATLAILNSESLGLPGWLVEKFYRWYAPRLHEMALPYARLHEYEADASAAALVGPEVMARALAALEGRAAVHYEMERRLRRMALAGEPLPNGLLTDFLERLKRNPDVLARIPIWLKRALRRNTDDEDTHPCLRERLAALGHPQVPPAALQMPERPALHALFGSESPRMLGAAEAMVQDIARGIFAEFDSRRKELELALTAVNARIHREGYRTFLVSKAMFLLAALERHEELLRLANRVRSAGEALRPLHAFYEAHARLETGDVQAFVTLLQLAGRHPWLMEDVADVAKIWLYGDGAAYDTPELRQELERMEEMHEQCQRAMWEMKKGMRVLSPEGLLTSDEEQEIRHQIETRRKHLRKAWIVARRCERMPGWVQVDVVVQFKRWAWFFRGYSGARAKQAEFMEELGKALPIVSMARQGLAAMSDHLPYAYMHKVRKAGRRVI